MLINLLILIVGFALLIKCADILVDGAASFAKKMGISTIVIGLTIVAFGTSAPELIVNLFASAQGNVEIAIGNIIGSNIANILLILGISALINNLPSPKATTWKEIPFAFLAVIVVFLMANDQIVDGQNFSIISRSEGLIMIGFFIIFLYYTFNLAKTSATEDDVKIKEYKKWQSIAMVVGGLIGLTIGGKLVVDSAVSLATAWGVSQSLIGLTIVAIGTSLPELVTSAVAAYKKQSNIAIGNIVGSNIFNIFWILGLSAVIRPLPFSASMNFDILVCLVTTLLLFAFMLIGKRYVVQRWQGGLLLVAYVTYLAFLIVRG
jgi:cation:H+ antiporter